MQFTNLSERSWPQVQKYLKDSQSVILPVGSTEQHGPTGLLGVDYLTAWKIAEEVGKRNHILVTPPLCFGMAQHHMAFPGTISFTPTTYILVLKELLQSLSRHGFRKIYLINGHGGNIAPITTAFSEVLLTCPELSLKLYNWWHLSEVTDYEKIHFGEKNGFHATCGELSVTMHLFPEAHRDQVLPSSWPANPKDYAWPMAADNFRKNFPDGRMHSSPELASIEHGKKLFEIATESLSKSITR